MDQRDEEFQKKLMATFKVEAREHLSAISSGLIELEKAPAEKQPAIIEIVYRESHSLKGAARSVNLPEVVSVCQAMESVFSALKRGAISIAPGQIDVLYEALDRIGKLVSGEAASQTIETNDLIRRLEAAVSGSGPPAPGTGQKHERAAGRPPESDTSKPDQDIRASSADTSPVSAPPAALSETVRISTAKLDSLFLQAEELLSVKLATGQRAAELRDVKKTFGLWKKEYGKARGRGAEGLAKFTASLEAKLTTLVKAAEYDHRSFGAKVDSLLDNMKKALMLPFSSLADAFPRLARDLSRDAGKDADLTIVGKDIELDRRILEEMKDPIMHLVRNCVDHGIEMPDERERKKKTPKGGISIAVASRDNKVEIVVSDDGAGIDITKITSSAVKQGILSREEADRLDEREALLLIFHSGVTTSSIITDLSGRGLGLAIVREKVEKLNGAVSVETRPDEGTTFRMVVPVTLATFRGVLVRVGEQVFVLPSTNVERVVRVKREEIKSVENRETLSLNERAISFSRLGNVLGVSGDPRDEGRGTRDVTRETRDELVNRPSSKRSGRPSSIGTETESVLQAVVLGSAEKRMAFQVDEVLQEQEVLVKALGRQLSRVRNVAGATVLGNGKAVLILNVPDLMKSAVKITSPSPIRSVPGDKAKRRSILVVEDSITSRSLLKNILDSAGYDVKAAVDGVDAFTALRTQTFELVVSDVQMPRMDGFELTARIRADKKLSDLPVVLVTALESREDREHGIDVGANAYIVKSSFEQSNLLSVIQQLI